MRKAVVNVPDGVGQKIAVTVIIVTKNEERHIARCLDALVAFDDLIVVDSRSTDDTKSIARRRGARVVDFDWNNQYPKKRQWCLDVLTLAHDWVFFVDADEIVPPDLIGEIRDLDLSACAHGGFLVRGRYVFDERALRFGLMNNKVALLNRHKMEFPVVDDLDILGMGEIEGHYQPVLKTQFSQCRIGQIRTPLLHHSYDDQEGWLARHKRYAQWETGMDARKAWPHNMRWRKRVFKKLPLRGAAAFLHCYILKLGFLDGGRGLKFAQSRAHYYRMIR